MRFANSEHLLNRQQDYDPTPGCVPYLRDWPEAYAAGEFRYS